MLTLAVFVSFGSTVAPLHASASPRVLAHSVLSDFDASASASFTDSSMFAGRFGVRAKHTRTVEGALVRSQLAEAPAAAVSSTPVESQHPATPIEAEAPESGEGSIEAGDDLSDFDDFAYHLRVVWSGSTQLHREVERGVSLGGRAVSRLEDNRSDKPPRG